MSNEIKDWVLVPRESTSEMDFAGVDIAEDGGVERFDRADAERVWIAMLAAAPTPPADEGCGACGDGCRERGSCRLQDESPPAEAQVAGGVTDEMVERAMWAPLGGGTYVRDHVSVEVVRAALSAQPRPSADRQAIRMLVAAGFVTEAKANEALNIAHGFTKGELQPQPASAPVGEFVQHQSGDGTIARKDEPQRRMTVDEILAAMNRPSAPVGVDAVNPDDADGGIDGHWYCERHPWALQGHDGCVGAGLPGCARIDMLRHIIRMRDQELRERDQQYGFLAKLALSAQPRHTCEKDPDPLKLAYCHGCAEGVPVAQPRPASDDEVQRVAGAIARVIGHGMTEKCEVHARAAIAAMSQPASAPVGVGDAWQEGYQQGVLDERTSEANIGITGYGAKIEPARVNPYALAQQPRPDDGEAVACQWRLDSSPYAEIWESACGESWSFTTDGPAENNVRFCHGCGKPVNLTAAQQEAE